MGSRNSYLSPPQPPVEPPPMLLRMLHPTSGRQGFHGVGNPAGGPSPALVDPRFAAMINMQTQQAIAASGGRGGMPPSGSTHHGPSPYGHGAGRSHGYYSRR